jgi:hypothetical protein
MKRLLTALAAVLLLSFPAAYAYDCCCDEDEPPIPPLPPRLERDADGFYARAFGHGLDSAIVYWCMNNRRYEGRIHNQSSLTVAYDIPVGHRGETVEKGLWLPGSSFQWVWRGDMGIWLGSSIVQTGVVICLNNIIPHYSTIDIMYDDGTVYFATPEDPAEPDNPGTEPGADIEQCLSDIIILLTIAVIGIGILIGAAVYRTVRGAWEVS